MTQAPLAQRKVVVFMSVSLDGYIEGPGHDISWHRVDDDLHRHFNEQLKRMGAFLDGRKTYELMAGFWPTADQDPSSTEPMVEFAGIWRDMPKVVFSTTLKQAGWNTTILRSVDGEQIRALKSQPGGDLAVGGAELTAALMEQDLVDELQIYVHPVLVGDGKPLLPRGRGTRDLRLLETRAFGNGVVLLKYARAVHEPQARAT